MSLTCPEPLQVSVVLWSLTVSQQEEQQRNYVIHTNDVPRRISVYIDRISKADSRDATQLARRSLKMGKTYVTRFQLTMCANIKCIDLSR